MSERSSKRRKLKDSSASKPNDTAPITDPRFASIQSDPRYQLPSKRHTHVKVDNRFSRILKDDDFSRKAKVDRYGRPVETDAESKRLKRRYEFENDENHADDNNIEKELSRIERIQDPLREGRETSSSFEGSSSDEESEVEDEVEDSVGSQQKEEVPMGEVTSRIAVVNLDWDNIRAADLMAVFSSFLPPNGRLLNIVIYPSEFGKERMEREEMEGPPKELFTASQADGVGSDFESVSENDDEIKEAILKPDDGSEFDSAALRAYQLQRLRYYYAVLTFSTPAAAKHVYDACDGTEYLSTANFFDLRFIPDDTDFSTDTPREQCDGVPDGYKPNEFVTDALQHSKVRLTWDAEDGGRKEAQARAFGGSRKEIDENDLKAYLGSDSSEEDEIEIEENDDAITKSVNQPLSKKEQERQRMRALLGLAAEPIKKAVKDQGPVGDLQITFSSGLLSKNGTGASVFQNEPDPQETTVEKYVRKERERKQKRKEKAKAAREGLPAAEQVESEISDQDVVGGDDTEDKAADLGFDDPFFAEPANDTRTTNKMRKEERLKKRAEREKEEAANKAERAQLELLMTDDKERDVQHFNMDEIEKAEKRRNKKKGKKTKKAKSTEQAEEAAVDGVGATGFKMDTMDPRFARLYENHEFAIDPTNPRFRGTEGMKSLLEEGRRRRQKDPENKNERDQDPDQKKPRKPVDNTNSRDMSTKALIEKMKRGEIMN